MRLVSRDNKGVTYYSQNDWKNEGKMIGGLVLLHTSTNSLGERAGGIVNLFDGGSGLLSRHFRFRMSMVKALHGRHLLRRSPFWP